MMIDFLFNLLDKIFKKDQDIHIDNSINHKVNIGDINSNNTFINGNNNNVGNNISNYNSYIYSKPLSSDFDLITLLAIFLFCVALVLFAYAFILRNFSFAFLPVLNLFLLGIIFLLFKWSHNNSISFKYLIKWCIAFICLILLSIYPLFDPPLYNFLVSLTKFDNIKKLMLFVAQNLQLSFLSFIYVVSFLIIPFFLLICIIRLLKRRKESSKQVMNTNLNLLIVIDLFSIIAFLCIKFIYF